MIGFVIALALCSASALAIIARNAKRPYLTPYEQWLRGEPHMWPKAEKK